MKADLIKDYKKYRWFYTSSGKLVVGGKNAEQNEEILRSLLPKTRLDIDSRTSLKEYIGKKYVIMHTKTPGSPFAIILDENHTSKDLIETEIFTASFSRAWREGKKKVIVDTFLLQQVYKNKNMKIGTFGVIDSIDTKDIELKLYLAKQKGVLRAIPYETDYAIPIIPGKVPKEKFAQEIAVKLDINNEEVLNALPTGSSDFDKTVIIHGNDKTNLTVIGENGLKNSKTNAKKKAKKTSKKRK